MVVTYSIRIRISLSLRRALRRMESMIILDKLSTAQGYILYHRDKLERLKVGYSRSICRGDEGVSRGDLQGALTREKARERSHVM